MTEHTVRDLDGGMAECSAGDAGPGPIASIRGHVAHRLADELRELIDEAIEGGHTTMEVEPTTLLALLDLATRAAPAGSPTTSTPRSVARGMDVERLVAATRLPQPAPADHPRWDDELTMTRRELHELLNRHTESQIRDAFAAQSASAEDRR